MKILLVGNGAREHAVAERIAEVGGVELYALMSHNNPAIAKLSKAHAVMDIMDGKKVAEWASSREVDLAFVSPDAVLAAGVSDALERAGIPVASPRKEAARIEWDKGFARNLLQKHNVPGAIGFALAKSEQEAASALERFGDVAVKPLGLTGGKGVKISGEHLPTKEDALNYCRDLLKKDGSVLLEEKLEGEEFSLQAFTDGKSLSFMPPVQDHKRAYNDDKGPNTGSMGSYSTGPLLPFMAEADLESAKESMRKTVSALAKEGIIYKGVLYGQFMLTVKGPKIIEFNARFGDPEAINVLALLETPLPEILASIVRGSLADAKFSQKCTVVKYVVPEGYPEKPVGDSEAKVDTKAISALGAKIFFASVYEAHGEIYTTRSRAFATLGLADSISDAEKSAEEATKHIQGKVWHREDIGTAPLIEKHGKHMEALRSGQGNQVG
ncbi:MAG: phosphoribosylamine--glycine ligase [Candidatus Bilamarchaeaceae archaeon]